MTDTTNDAVIPMDEESLYRKAVQLVVDDQKASTSYVQRKLQLGYNHAAALIERMELEKIVSAPDHRGVRAILLASDKRPAVPTITIQMGKPCAECGEGGATDNGLCLSCTTLALGATPLKSAIGQAVQERFKNSNKANKEGHSVAKTGFAKQHLRAFIDRIERLEEERAALTADIREVYSEAKGTGFDTKILRQVIRMRKLDKADFQEQEAILDLYLNALDMR